MLSLTFVSSSTAESARSRLRRDLVLVALVPVLTAVIGVRLELNEAIFAATRRFEHLQLDELPAALVALSLALAWFAARRYREARSELVRRAAVEAELERLLEENRRLSQSHLRMQESERKVIARELHDELGQYLNAIKTDAVSIQRQTEDGPGSVRRAAAAIVQNADHVHSVVRDLIRRLRPVGLDELGLRAALENCLDDWQPRLAEVRFAISLEGSLDDLGEPVSLTLYRLVQEALSNVASHSGARHVEVRLARTGVPGTASDAIVLRVADDGKGADPRAARRGLGLIGMRERVEMLGGQLSIVTAPAGGFRIDVRIPLHPRATERVA